MNQGPTESRSVDHKGVKGMDRRRFLGRSAVLAAAPVFIPASALGKDGRPAPSERITLGAIGTGNQGFNDLQAFLSDERVQVVAVSDVNRESPGYWFNTVRGREPGRELVDEYYAGHSESGAYRGCAAYADYREMLARADIDAVQITTPDHWHERHVTHAARAGKHIYGQKPLALTIRQGRRMVVEVARAGVVFQCGSQQRSDGNFRRVCELALNGRLGRIHTVRVGLPGGTPDYGQTGKLTDPQPVPDGFDYDAWLGPAPLAPYCPARCHVNFRWILDYSGGQVTDWGGHHPDIAQWGLGTTHTGPVAIENPRATWAVHPIWNTAAEFHFEAVYKSGVRLIISDKERGGVEFQGDKGKAWADRGRHEVDPPALADEVIGEDEIRLPVSNQHYRNFIDAVLGLTNVVAPIEEAHRSITIAHLGNIAMRLGRGLKWDPQTEQIVGDDEATTMLDRPVRQGYRI